MKKILCLILTVVFLLFCVGCSTPTQTEETPDTGGSTDFGEDVVLPPTRIGKGGMHVLLGKNYTFEEAMEEADAVALIQVGNWIGEDNELHETYFEAKVMQCFKGNIPENFTLLQSGSSECTITKPMYPLFTYGNEFLVFLNEAVGLDYESPYWIIGAYTTILDVSYDDDGNRYYADRYGILGNTINISANYAHRGEIYSEIYTKATAKDPIVSELQYKYKYVFSEADMMSLIEDCKK